MSIFTIRSQNKQQKGAHNNSEYLARSLLAILSKKSVSLDYGRRPHVVTEYRTIVVMKNVTSIGTF